MVPRLHSGPCFVLPASFLSVLTGTCIPSSSKVQVANFWFQTSISRVSWLWICSPSIWPWFLQAQKFLFLLTFFTTPTRSTPALMPRFNSYLSFILLFLGQLSRPSLNFIANIHWILHSHSAPWLPCCRTLPILCDLLITCFPHKTCPNLACLNRWGISILQVLFARNLPTFLAL